VFAQGAFDNIVLTVPPPPIQNFAGSTTNGQWHGLFLSRSNWIYTLERSEDLQIWTSILPAVAGNGTNLSVNDTNALGVQEFYRVRAERP